MISGRRKQGSETIGTHRVLEIFSEWSNPPKSNPMRTAFNLINSHFKLQKQDFSRQDMNLRRR